MTNTRLFTLITLIALLPLRLIAQIDMQAHVGSDESKKAYTTYTGKQNKYYTGTYAYSSLISLTNDALFGRINTLMGNTSQLKTGYSYDKLKDAYKTVDRDLNTNGYIISYYDGSSFEGIWDGGDTWNREHTWPQSKGAKTGPINYDMQSVRPANKSVNSSRGNKGYGESGSYYDPNEIAISNGNYKTTNLGTYRGDCARVIMYDYLVYGHAGGYQNTLHSGTAQLLEKIGSNPVKSDSIVFESLHTMLKWHMQDPPSLTEMVRNDGAQDYQGNRNPLIDYPELAIQVFLEDIKELEDITTYSVTESSAATMWPAHQYTLSDGFIAYLTNNDGSHPQNIEVTGATSTYDKSNGRLTITNVTGNMTISDVAAATYTLTWNANGGQLSGTYTSGQVTPGTAITAPTATRSGYQFTGWSPTFTGTMPAANTTYIAQWQAQTIYTVTWMANGSIHHTATYNIDGSETIQLPAAPAACDGYTFVGWITEANYSNPFCAPGDIFTSATHKVTTNLTYYAVFKKN